MIETKTQEREQEYLQNLPSFYADPRVAKRDMPCARNNNLCQRRKLSLNEIDISVSDSDELCRLVSKDVSKQTRRKLSGNILPTIQCITKNENENKSKLNRCKKELNVTEDKSDANRQSLSMDSNTNKPSMMNGKCCKLPPINTKQKNCYTNIYSSNT